MRAVRFEERIHMENSEKATSNEPLKLKSSLLPSWTSLDAYILSEINSPFLMAMLVYNGIFFIKIIGSVTELSQGKFEIPFTMVMWYFLSALPEILFLTTALSFLFASLAAMSRMSADSEIIAPQSVGISFWRLSRPIMVYGLILSMILFVIMNIASPKINQTWQMKYKTFIETVALPNITPGVLTSMGKDAILYVDRVDDGKLAELISINQSKGKEELIMAQQASIFSDRTIKLYEAHDISLQFEPQKGEKNEAVKMWKFESASRRIPIPEDFSSGNLNLTVKDLLKTPSLYKYLKNTQATDLNLWTEFYERLFSPLICVIFALFAAPLAAKHSRLRKGSGFGMSLLLIGFYFFMTKLGRDAAVSGKIAPILGVGIPPLLFLILGVILQFGKNFGWNRHLEKLQDGIAYRISRLGRMILLVFRKRNRNHKEDANIQDDGHIAQTFVFPSKLDTYVIRSFFSIYLLVQSSLLVLLVLLEYTQISKFVQRNNIAPGDVVRYLLYKIPEILHQSLFICLLIAVLILFAMMSKSQEVTVIRAGGGSLQRLCLPLLFCGFLATCASFYMENAFLPQTSRMAIGIRNKIKNLQNVTFPRDVWLRRPNGDILNYKYYDPQSQTLTGVKIYRISEGTPRKMERYDLPGLTYNGTWVAQKPGAVWTFFLAAENENLDFRPREVEVGDHFTIDLDLEDLSKKTRKPAEFSIKELKDYLAYLKSLGFDAAHYQTSLYAKYAQPMVPFIMMMLAMPLGFQFGRRGTFYGVGAGLVAGMVFFGLMELFKTFGSSGIIAPLTAGWSVVAFFGFVALYRFINLE